LQSRSEEPEGGKKLKGDEVIGQGSGDVITGVNTRFGGKSGGGGRGKPLQKPSRDRGPNTWGGGGENPSERWNKKKNVPQLKKGEKQKKRGAPEKSKEKKSNVPQSLTRRKGLSFTWELRGENRKNW